jgi:hypothetical protein
MTVHLSYILATVSRKDFRGYCPRGWGALLGAKGQEALADGCPWRQARSCETSLLKCGQASATQLRPRGRTAICAKSRTTWHIAAAAILNMVHQYSRPETFPRIPHIPRGRTLATANRGMRGMGEDIAVYDLVSLVSSNAKRTNLERRSPGGMPRSGRPMSPDARGWRPADSIAAARRRIIKPIGKGSQCVAGVR